MKSEDSKETSANEDAQRFELNRFFPYQTRIFYKEVNTKISRVYEERYNMKPNEWRALAILGENDELTANQIVEKSSLDKVSISRALASLNQRKWLTQRRNKDDGRSRLIGLRAAGREAYETLVPLMLTAEKEVLSVYSDEEVRLLKTLFAKIKDQTTR